SAMAELLFGSPSAGRPACVACDARKLGHASLRTHCPCGGGAVQIAVRAMRRSQAPTRSRPSDNVDSRTTHATRALVVRPLVEVRRSRIQGRGVFALEDLAKGTHIIEYVGERITMAEADQRYDDESVSRHHTFLFVVDKTCVIDAAKIGNDA